MHFGKEKKENEGQPLIEDVGSAVKTPNKVKTDEAVTPTFIEAKTGETVTFTPPDPASYTAKKLDNSKSVPKKFDAGKSIIGTSSVKNSSKRNLAKPALYFKMTRKGDTMPRSSDLVFLGFSKVDGCACYGYYGKDSETLLRGRNVGLLHTL